MQGKLQGEEDVPLSETGEAQANIVAQVLSALDVRSVFCSPLVRAVGTAKIILQFHANVPFVLDRRLSEVNFGNFSGRTWGQIRNENPEFLEQREADKWHHRWPAGESYKDVYERISGFIDEYGCDRVSEPRKGATIIVAHETVNKVLVGRLMGWCHREIITKGHPNTILYRIQRSEVARFDTSDPESGWVSGMIEKDW